MIIILSAAALGAFLLLLVVLLAVRSTRRSRRKADERVADVVAGLSARMDELARELEAARERAEEEGRRHRLLGELTGSIDLDDVLTRALEASASLPGVDAALITVSGNEGRPLVATLGLSAEEAERQVITGPPDGRPARSVTISYRYPDDENGEERVHAGLAVPLPGSAEAARLGFLTVFTREAGRTFGDDDLTELESLAARAGPAIENARRFREARQLADLDALTGLHNRRFFHETLAREVARAHRYDRKLALIVFDLDDFKSVNDRIGHLAADSVLADAAGRVRDVVRSADIACRVGGDEFAVLMPESSVEDADLLYQRIQQSVSTRPIGQGGTLFFSAGAAGLQPGDDATAFFQRADDALYRAKETGKARVVNANAAS